VTAEIDATERGGVRFARLLASPIGVLITIPALVVAVGIGILLVGRDATRSASNQMAGLVLTTNATSVKATAGDLFKVSGNNTVASKRYLKLYNKASAPTVGTDTPVLTFVLPASLAFDISISNGSYFSTGIAYAITGAAADADTTAIGAGDIECLNIGYA